MMRVCVSLGYRVAAGGEAVTDTGAGPTLPVLALPRFRKNFGEVLTSCSAALGEFVAETEDVGLGVVIFSKSSTSSLNLLVISVKGLSSLADADSPALGDLLLLFGGSGSDAFSDMIPTLVAELILTTGAR